MNVCVCVCVCVCACVGVCVGKGEHYASPDAWARADAEDAEDAECAANLVSCAPACGVSDAKAHIQVHAQTRVLSEEQFEQSVDTDLSEEQLEQSVPTALQRGYRP